MFSKIKQSKKEIWIVFFAFFILIVFSIGSRLYALNQIKYINNITTVITQHPLQVSNAALNLQIQIYQFREDIMQIVFFPDKRELARHLDNIHLHEEEAKKNLELIKHQILGDQGKALVYETEILFNERKVVREQVIQYVLNDDMHEAQKLFKFNESSYKELNDITTKLYQYSRNKATYFQKQADDLYANFEQKNQVILIGLVTVFVLLMYYVIHRISKYIYANEELTESLKEKSDELERIATIDKLTGVYNRHKFEDILILEMERSRRFSQPLSLILIDIDHFKIVNDTYGHDVGDEVLKYLVKIVQDTIRQIDVFARWGGEEFLILSPSTDLENVQLLAEKLRFSVEHADFPKVSHVTISQGVAMFEEKDTFNDVFKRVDKGLYWAKKHGRNQVGVITS